MRLVTSSPTAKTKWDPADYAAHSSTQQAWARELIGRLHLRGDEHILDVGCGDGKVTAELAAAVPRGSVTGIDASAEMIRYAAARFPKIKFFEMDARAIRLEEKFDVIFSNATLHWVDDHEAFLQGAAGCLKHGGRLLVSCGGKGNAQEVFVALRGVIRLKRWREYFRKMTAPYFFHSPAQYQKWLPRAGFDPQLIRLAEKPVAFHGREALAAWLRTTWLPYTQRVPESSRREFTEAVADRYIARHPAENHGSVRVGMVRLEIEATRQ
jgi:trans-aconitate 2-methyltransferase